MADDTPGGRRSDWNEYSRLVLSELKRNSELFDRVNEKIETIRADDLAQLKADIMLLKFQAAMWGAFGGAILTGIVSLAVKFLK